jgi:hypothetical protein
MKKNKKIWIGVLIILLLFINLTNTLFLKDYSELVSSILVFNLISSIAMYSWDQTYKSIDGRIFLFITIFSIVFLAIGMTLSLPILFVPFIAWVVGVMEYWITVRKV